MNDIPTDQPHDASSTKIDIQHFNLFYNDFQALHNISLQVQKNTVMALIGPSGCGKSTLLRSINRMNDLIDGCRVEGQILVESQDVYKETDMSHLRKRIGMVFQKPNPFPMSIYENITYGPRVHGIKDKAILDHIVESSLKKAALWEELKGSLKKSALQISGGQQQRLCIARMIAVEPEILLLDEPTSALDPISTGKIEELLHDLKKKYTIMIVTHNMQQAARVADQTAFFLFGNMVEVANSAEIFNSPKDMRTADYVMGRFG
ncbi:MAG: phosphate ABC transporter ATP-binding protein PstB [Spirochaetia bacterium]